MLLKLRQGKRRNIRKKLLSKIEEHGIKGQVVSTHHLVHLEEEIEEKHGQRFFDPELYKEYLSGFKFKLPESLSDAKSIIIIAYPQPQIRIIFNLKGSSYPLILPPTYLQYPDKRVEEILPGLLNPQGYRLAKAVLPLKVLAVRSGLGFYGKNNICYVEGMGSFHRLLAFYPDFPCSEDSWPKARIMEGCKKCVACQRSCPTGLSRPNAFFSGPSYV